MSQFLGPFEKLRKVIINFGMSVCLSVLSSACPHATPRSPLDGFSLNLIFDYRSNMC
jgi:hypothetical protein